MSLIKDSDWFVRRGVSENPNLPTNIAQPLIDSLKDDLLVFADDWTQSVEGVAAIDLLSELKNLPNVSPETVGEINDILYNFYQSRG
jgi:hypothetical protein